MPRRLTLLRINDAAQYFDVEDLDDTPPGLAAFATSGVRRITGSRAHQMFWQGDAVPPFPPDLLLIDLNFERDQEEPLKSPMRVQVVGEIEDRVTKPLVNIPTGLLHALPFLTWGRVSGRIVAHAFHTGGLEFRRGPGEIPELGSVIAAMLAAVASAISRTGAGSIVTRDDLAAAHTWIDRSFESNPDGAIRSALRQWRKLLVQEVAQSLNERGVSGLASSTIPDPEGLTTLLTFVECVGSGTHPLPVDPSCWPGLPLIYADGKTDSIMLESLFADAEGGLEEGDFNLKAGVSDPCTVNRGRPAIANFLALLTGWGGVCDQASSFVSLLPLGRGKQEETLNALIRNGRPLPGLGPGVVAPAEAVVSRQRLVRLLTVLFQVVRQHHAAAESLAKSHRDLCWDSTSHRFTEAHQPGQTLPDLVARLFIFFLNDVHQHIGHTSNSSSNQEQRITVGTEGLIEALDHEGIDRKYASFYLGCLADSGLLTPGWEAGALGEWKTITLDLLNLQNIGVLGSWETIRNPQISFERLVELVRGHPPRQGEGILPDWIDGGRVSRTVLAENIGYGAESMTAMSRIIAEGLGLSREKDATTFLDEFEIGTSKYGWLRELCRQYARKRLGWSDERNWPPILRGQ